MSRPTGLELSPAAEWRGGRRRAGVAVGPAELWMAAVDPRPDSPRLIALHALPLQGHAGSSHLVSETAGALNALWRRARVTDRQTLLALAAGVQTTLIDLPPTDPSGWFDALREGGHAGDPAESPVLAVVPVDSTPARTRLFVESLPNRLLLAWRRIFGQAGLGLRRIEPFAWCVLRGLVACGDIGPEGRWGLGVVSQGRVWIGLWEGDSLRFWREGAAPRVAFTADGLPPSPDALMTLARSITAAWQFGGSGRAATFWVVGDDGESAQALARVLSDGGVPARVPLHATRGPLARGGAAALAAVGAAAADVLAFPNRFRSGVGRKRLVGVDVPRRAVLAGMALMAALAFGGLGHWLVSRQSMGLDEERRRLEVTLADMRAAASDSESEATSTWAAGWPLEEVLEQVRRAIPKDTWLTAMDVLPDGQVELKGEALTAKSPLMFTWNLDHVRGWRRVRVARIVEDGGVIAFTLKAEVSTSGGLR
jgi:hypothetical protein